MNKQTPYHQDGTHWGHHAGVRVARGAKQGREVKIPEDYRGQKLMLQRVPLDQGYDPGGAYWGDRPAGLSLWCSWTHTATAPVEVYVDAANVTEAMQKVTAQFANKVPAAPRFKDVAVQS